MEDPRCLGVRDTGRDAVRGKGRGVSRGAIGAGKGLALLETSAASGLRSREPAGRAERIQIALLAGLWRWWRP